jgi:LPS export ABC transporter permease LptG/LPS export ABC transporter permease LptF
MIAVRRLIPKYVIGAAAPYVLLSLALLTAILFAQQSERFAELALYAQLPFALFAQIAAYLIPSVLVFTLPLAVLAGVTIGFSRMGSDSEIVAMRAAGVGTWTMLWPTLLVGLTVTIPTVYINLKEAPRSARILRRAALQGAMRKLDSPVEPRTFTSEIPGYVIYVREGNKAEGIWGRVFIYAKQADGSTRVVTARSGRIDSSGEKSELVLNDAVGISTPASGAVDHAQDVVERSDQIRIAINTGRAAILAKLRNPEQEPEEMEWSELRRATQAGSLADRKDAARTMQRRIALSISPFLFALIGGVLGLRVRRGGRGIGILLSIAVGTIYYLFSLLGEQLGRAGTVSPAVGSWLSTGVLLVLSIAFLTMGRQRFSSLLSFRTRKLPTRKTFLRNRAVGLAAAGHWGFPSLLDAGMLRTLFISFVISFISLVSLVIIFTLFELWKSIITNRVSAGIVTKYFLFMLPLISVEVSAATMLIAVLITYALLAKRSEAIAWWASGQSVYRLMFPGLLFALVAAIGTWTVQEKLMPQANVRQSSLRALIRGGAALVMTPEGRQWLASADSYRLYSYEYDERSAALSDLAIYEFDSQGIHLERIISANRGKWEANNLMTIKNAGIMNIQGLEIRRETKDQTEIAGVDSPSVFKPTVDKPAQLSSKALSNYVRVLKRRGVDVSALAVALQGKYAEPFGVGVMALLGMPLAIRFGRRGTIVALCAAVAASLAYWGFNGAFQQLGNHGLLPSAVAGWAPPIIFAAIGAYFLSRTAT